MAIVCEPHKHLNKKKGLIHCPELHSTPTEEILKELAEQGIVEVTRVSRRGPPSPTPSPAKLTHLYTLTFALHSLPREVRVGYLQVPLKPYIPNPLRCAKCLRLGHHGEACRSKATCGSCGHEKSNNEHQCDLTPYCVNCRASHSPFDRACPSWLRERRIREIQVTRDVSLQEARRIERARTAGPPQASCIPQIPTLSTFSFPHLSPPSLYQRKSTLPPSISTPPVKAPPPPEPTDQVTTLHPPKPQPRPSTSNTPATPNTKNSPEIPKPPPKPSQPHTIPHKPYQIPPTPSAPAPDRNHPSTSKHQPNPGKAPQPTPLQLPSLNLPH